MAIANLLRDKGLQVDAVAGLSLGEYSALCYASSFSIQEGVKLLTDRGRIMADFIPDNTGMAVVLSLEPDVVQSCCDEASQTDSPCEIASFVTPNRMVITGELAAVARASELCLKQGARMVVPVNASGAFHSVLAKEARDKFESILIGYEIKQPQIPVYYNVDGGLECNDVAAVLAGQLQKSVQFVRTIQNMCTDGITHFIAIGPGTALADIARDTARHNNTDIMTYAVETYDDALKLLEKVGTVL